MFRPLKSADPGRGQQACEICWLLVVCMGHAGRDFWRGAGSWNISRPPWNISRPPCNTSPLHLWGPKSDIFLRKKHKRVTYFYAKYKKVKYFYAKYKKVAYFKKKYKRVTYFYAKI